jgi:hypothetical protein
MVGLVLAVLAVAGGAVPSAQAGCGGVVAAEARGPVAVGRAPLAIGDSTSIYAAPILGRLGVEANAKGCRQFTEGVSLLRARRAAGTLPAVVVLALGANGPVPQRAMEQALSILGPRRILLLVTAKHADARNGALRAAARRHPDRVVLVDWVAASAGHPGWFSGDGLHVGQAGATAFAQLIKRSLARFSFPPVRRLRVPRQAAATWDCGAVGRGRRVYLIRGKATCGRARALARGPATRAPGGWTRFDWRRAHIGPWSWIVERNDHRVVVGVVG